MSFQLSQWALALPRSQHTPSPCLRGEGWDEGRRHASTFAIVAAPHPSPLPVRTGRGDLAAFRDGWCFDRRSVREIVR